VAELFLNRSKIRTRSQEVGRATVAECVWVEPSDAIGRSSFSYNSPSRSVAQSFVKPIEEHGAFRRKVVKPVLEGFDGGWTKRYNSLFLALAQDPNQAVSQIKIDDIEIHCLADPEPCPIHQLQEGSISI
jgi:hypothetical protein